MLARNGAARCRRRRVAIIDGRRHAMLLVDAFAYAGRASARPGASPTDTPRRELARTFWRARGAMVECSMPPLLSPAVVLRRRAPHEDAMRRGLLDARCRHEDARTRCYARLMIGTLR